MTTTETSPSASPELETPSEDPVPLGTPGYSYGPHGLRGTHSNPGTRSYRDPRVDRDLDTQSGADPWKQCRDHGVTSQLSDNRGSADTGPLIFKPDAAASNHQAASSGPSSYP